MNLEMIRAIAERSNPQLGLLTRDQFQPLGLTKDGVYRLRRSGLVVPVGRRTFRVVGAPVTFEQRVLAACLDTGGIACARTAAHLHSLHGFPEPKEIEVLIVHGRHHSTSPIARVHATTNLPADDVIRVGPIPCTGVARTFLGLAALVPEVPAETLRDAFDVAARDGLVSEAWMWWRLQQLRCRGRNGIIAMEDLLRDRQKLGPTESWLERTFMELLQLHGLPLPTVQKRVRNTQGGVVRVDTAYDDRALVIELDGYGSHSTRAQKNNDEKRRGRLVAAGHTVIVFTYDHVVCEPDEVVELVAAARSRTGAA